MELDQQTLGLINDVVKPWYELNAMLGKQIALDPRISDATRLASSLAVAIKHRADLQGIKPRTPVDQASLENRMMSDIADAAKHGGGNLERPGRNNTLGVASCFEYSAQHGFRFRRNLVTVDHATYGELDFMPVAAKAIQYWADRANIVVNPALAVTESGKEFFPKVVLRHDPRHCISLRGFNLKFVERAQDGSFHPVDPPRVELEFIRSSGFAPDHAGTEGGG